MNQNNTGNMQDKDMMLDALSIQKLVTGNYSVTANECATKKVRDDMLNLLQEEHEIQADLFTEIHSRGWYPTTPAEQPKVDMAKQKYMNMTM